MWTKTAPTEAGWYWNRKGSFKRGGPLVPIELRDDGDGLGAFSERADEFVLAQNLGGEWWSEPIQEPK